MRPTDDGEGTGMPGIHDRRPSAVDRPPVSRYGDELQQRADDAMLRGSDDGGRRTGGRELDAVDEERIERASLEAARHKGWDSTLEDVEPPPHDDLG